MWGTREGGGVNWESATTLLVMAGGGASGDGGGGGSRDMAVIFAFYMWCVALFFWKERGKIRKRAKT